MVHSEPAAQMHSSDNHSQKERSESCVIQTGLLAHSASFQDHSTVSRLSQIVFRSQWAFKNKKMLLMHLLTQRHTLSEHNVLKKKNKNTPKSKENKSQNKLVNKMFP